MIFYNVLQCMRERCVPKEYLDECVVDISTFENEVMGKSDSDEPIVQGALICTKDNAIDHDLPIITILRSTHTIHITFPKLIPNVIMFIRISHNSVAVDSSGKDPLSGEMLERVQYFGKAVSNCLLNILPQGSDIYFKDNFQQRLMSMMEKFNAFIASLPDDDDDTDDDDDAIDVESSTDDTDDETDE